MPPSRPSAPPSTTTSGAGHLTESTRQKPIMPIATVERGMTADSLHACRATSCAATRPCTCYICSEDHGRTAGKKKGEKKRKKDRTSRQIQAGIGHSAPAHRGGQVQNRIRRRHVLRGKIEHSSEAEQPRTDGGPSRQGKACQLRRGRGLAGAHRSRHPKKERCNKIQTAMFTRSQLGRNTRRSRWVTHATVSADRLQSCAALAGRRRCRC